MTKKIHVNMGDMFSGAVAGALSVGGVSIAAPSMINGIHNVLTQAFSTTTVPGAIAVFLTAAAATGVPFTLMACAFAKTAELVAMGSAAKRQGFTMSDDKTSDAPKAPAPQFGK